MRWYLLVGRLLFGGAFVFSAARHLASPSALTDAVAAHGVPYAHAVALGSALALGLGGLGVLLGLRPRFAIPLIVLVLIPDTAIVHPFWTAPDAAARSLELAFVTKDLALVGAALGLLAVPTPWPLSVDAWLARHTGRTRWPWGGGASGADAGVASVLGWLRRATLGIRAAALGAMPTGALARVERSNGAAAARVPALQPFVHAARLELKLAGPGSAFTLRVHRAIDARPDRRSVIQLVGNY
jgi:putative oxidoreductase